MDKDVEKQILQAFIISTCRVFSSLTDRKLQPQGVEKAELVLNASGVVVIVSFSGAFQGRILISMPKEISEIIYKSLGGENPTDEDLLLAANEFGNMVAGNAVTEINNTFKNTNLRLSPPSSFMGDGLTFFNFKMSAFNILLSVDNFMLKLNLALKEEKS